MRERFTIQDWASDERPREKFITRGAESLSDAELLAILIRAGNKDENAIELGRKILRAAGNCLNSLKKFTYNDLKKFRGVGPGKALSILAAFELGRRCEIEGAQQQPQIYSSHQAAAVAVPMLCHLQHEECWVLFLNKSNRLVGKERISSGGIDATVVDVRVILKLALEKNSCRIILVHNHPSGNRIPGETDKLQTIKLKNGAAVCEIQLVDHIIVAGNDYFSFADEGLL
jgi:DNA repair protein RadC